MLFIFVVRMVLAAGGGGVHQTGMVPTVEERHSPFPPESQPQLLSRTDIVNLSRQSAFDRYLYERLVVATVAADRAPSTCPNEPV